MKLYANETRAIGTRDPMIYGHFLEHFHRQVYDGVYCPGSPLADEDGFRTDVIDAMRKIRVPVLRWPGGCFVSSYHWKDAVGEKREPTFDISWRVEDPNTFGTDEYVKFCRKVGCEPYICTNAGTGDAEEMSDWVQYCNLKNEGKLAKWRIANGCEEPHNVKYWSIGNENWGEHEIGAKSSEEWGRLVLESAKMMLRADPTIELSAAALTDLDWNINLLKKARTRLKWVSIHEYWDWIQTTNRFADYKQSMAYTVDLEAGIRKVRGLLMAMGMEKSIRIAFDEWNLRGWYHPNIHTMIPAANKEDYLYPRDKNDINSLYTMADAVFSACFLNTCLRNCDIVGMANFAPIVNTRGCIFTHADGIVLRSTYHIFDLYVNYLGDVVLDAWSEDQPKMTVTHRRGGDVTVDAVDMVVTRFSDAPGLAVAAVNKEADSEHTITLNFDYEGREVRVYTVAGETTESYNDIDHEEVRVEESEVMSYTKGMEITLKPHSANVIRIL